MGLGHLMQVRGQGVVQFAVSESQQVTVAGEEGYITQVVKAGEDTGSRKTTDTGQEHKTQILAPFLENAVATAQGLSNWFQGGGISQIFDNGRIVFIYQHHDGALLRQGLN